MTKLKKDKNIIIIISLVILNVFSLISLYSSIYYDFELQNSIFYKQILWFIISWILLIAFSFINYRLYYNLTIPLYIFTVLLLSLVDMFGKTAMGSQRWLSIGGFNLQPSELSKITTIFILARFFSQGKQINFKKILSVLVLILINAFLIYKQPDLGSSLLIIFLFFFVGFFSGIKKIYFIILIMFGLTLLPFGFKNLKEYQKKRLLVFLNPNIDPLGAGYTIIQSKIAIGSGKIFGKGFLGGTQNQFNFLPERHTDFIFTVIAEEWGFLGSIFLIFIYYIILKKILDTSEQLKDLYAKILCIGITANIFLDIFINIGMTMGILPVVGIPLLFISYGGSHLASSFILMGIFLNIYKQNN